MNLSMWAKKWNIAEMALDELKTMYRIDHQVNDRSNPLSEMGVQNLVRLEASQKNCRLWRNNVGATYTKDGAFLRYGLANDSVAINRQIKSADLIGIKPVTITEELVGHTIGQFISREVKAASWRYTGTDRELAQLRWIELITSFGGDACFATGEGTI